MLITLAVVAGGTLLLFTGGAALVFSTGGGGVGGAIRELATGLPGGREIWASPWLGVGGGLALILVGLWLARS
jgi:hypothetical protein